MSLDLAYQLTIDAAKIGGIDCLLESGQAVPITQTPRFMQGDTIPLSVHFQTIVDGIAADAALAEGSVIALSAKESVDGAPVGLTLFAASGFANSTSESNIYYAASIDFGSAALAARLATAANGHLNVLVDIEVRNTSDSIRTTYRFAAVVYIQVYDGETGLAIMQAPLGGKWELTVSDTGDLSTAIYTGVGEPSPLLPVLTSPSGARWVMTIDDDGQYSTRRLT